MVVYNNGVTKDRSGDLSVTVYDFDSDGNEYEIEVDEDELRELLQDIDDVKSGKVKLMKVK